MSKNSVPLTEEEKKRRRNEASKKWYAAHKAKKAGAAKPAEQGAKHNGEANIVEDCAAAAKATAGTVSSFLELAATALARTSERSPEEFGAVKKALADAGFDANDDGTVGMTASRVWMAAARKPAKKKADEGPSDEELAELEAEDSEEVELVPVGGMEDVDQLGDAPCPDPLDDEPFEDDEPEDDDVDPDLAGREEMLREYDAMGVGEENE